MDVVLDTIKEQLQHPFFMLLGGMLLWFSLIWSMDRNKRREKGITFWEDQSDEIWVTLVFGLCLLVWDDEMLHAIFYTKDVIIRGGDAATWEAPYHELPTFMYLAIGFLVERFYKGIQLIRDWRKNGNGHSG